MLEGKLNMAAAPSPSLKSETPLPARVETTPPPAMVTARMRPFSWSATYTTPPYTATPVGELNMAFAPIPFLDPPVTCPASVVTDKKGNVITRIALLFVSAIKTVPLLSTVIPRGLLKYAFVPTPLIKSDEPNPAIVLTTPSGVTARMRWF